MVIQTESTRLTTGGTADLSLYCLGYHCTRAASYAPWDKRMDTKKCRKCGENKPFSEFYSHYSGKYGLRPRCKECLSAQIAVYYADHREAKALYQRQYRAANREKIAARAKEYSRQHKIECHVQGRTSYAIKRGKLIRQPCEMCGATENIVAHHDDYSKPLDVHWLCATHHKRLHAEHKRERMSQ